MAAGFSRVADGRFRVEGALGFETVAPLWSQSREALQGAGPLEVDLAGVTAVDSAGLALLVEWARWARQAGGTARFINVPAQLSSLARIGEVDDLLGLEDAAADGVQAAT
jgi:phospholipid transport system transporter-binding protein